MPVLQGRGKIVESDEIRFDKVPLISPNGDVLVKSMSFNVETGVSGNLPPNFPVRDTDHCQKHLLVVGPNGCVSLSVYDSRYEKQC